MASARNWVILVYDAAMVFKVAYSWTTDTLTMASGSPATVEPELANVQELLWHVTPNENSLEATWLGDSNGKILNIAPHDRVVIATLGYRAGETTTSYYPRFRGFASLPANQNHSDGEEHQYRALGIYRLLESVDTGPNYPIDEGQDLASGVADEIVTHSSADLSFTMELPAGITYSTFAAIGVTNTGKINPGSADLAQNLEALVTLCQLGGVEAATGVKPDGSLFFEVVDATTLTVAEGADGTLVQWTEPQADEVISAIRWVITDGNQDMRPFEQRRVSLDTPDLRTHLSDSGITTYGERVIPVSVPAEVDPYIEIDGTLSITQGTLHTSWVGTTEDGSPTLSRASDGDPSSYIVVTPDVGGFVTLRWVVDSSVSSARLAAISKTFKADPDSTEPDRALAYISTDADVDGIEPRSSLHVLWGSGRATGLASGVFRYSKGLNEVDGRLVFGDRATAQGLWSGFYVILTVGTEVASGTTRVAISDFRLWEVDRGVLNALAEQEYRFPEADAFEAVIQGESTPAGLASITKLDGTVISSLDVTAFGTRISGERGVETLLTVGPRTPAHISEELNRIKRRDRLAAIAGAKTGMRRR